MSDERLIPCPFCSRTKINLNTKKVGQGINVFYAVCKSCGAIGLKKTNEAKAVELWNRRLQDADMQNL